MLGGHRGDGSRVRAGLADDDARVRAAALGALDRLGEIEIDDLDRHAADPDPAVRRRVVELLATRPGTDLGALIGDADPSVAEVALWAAGEHGDAVARDLLPLVIDGTRHDDALCREAAVAALGSIGDPSTIDAVLEATHDKPAIRRRAIVALAAFDDPRVDEALRLALEDRDWQVRQAAETLLDL